MTNDDLRTRSRALAQQLLDALGPSDTATEARVAKEAEEKEAHDRAILQMHQEKLQRLKAESVQDDTLEARIAALATHRRAQEWSMDVEHLGQVLVRLSLLVDGVEHVLKLEVVAAARKNWTLLAVGAEAVVVARMRDADMPDRVRAAIQAAIRDIQDRLIGRPY